MAQPEKLGTTIARLGISEICALAFDLAYTLIRFPGARLLKRPVSIRGLRWIEMGPNFTSGPGLRIDVEPQEGKKRPFVRIGADVHLNDYVHIGAIESIVIGDRVLVASKVFISDHNHGSYGSNGTHSDPRIPPDKRPLSSAPVVIEDDVWIGEFVAVLPGVRIGKGSIIGAMSTVTRDIPPYCIAVGSPARVIKRYSFERKEWERV